MNQTFQLSFSPPYDWRSMLAYLRTRGSAGVEMVDDQEYRRTVSINESKGWLTVTRGIGRNELLVTLSPELIASRQEITTRLRALFDLDTDLIAVESVLGDLASKHSGLRIPGAFEPFEIAVRAILGQQISVKAATNLAGKLASSFGGAITTPYSELNVLAPNAHSLADANEKQLTDLGIMPSRARTIIALAEAYCRGALVLRPGADYSETVHSLTSIAGIGEWTAEYVAMRCLAYRDAFMHGDLGIKKALGETRKSALLQLAEKYRPWRAYAAMHLWKSLETTGV